MASYSDANKRLKTNGGGPAVPSQSTGATVSRPANNKLRLTVKAPPSKLRQATSGEHIHAIPPNPYTDASESDATPQPINRVARSTRNPRTVVEPDSDDAEDMEEDELDEEDDDEDEDEEEGEEEEEEEEDGAGDSEEEAEDDDMDELQKEPSPAPIIEAKGKGKPAIIKVQPPAAPLKSVEDQEMEDEDELSELESNEDENENENENDEDDEEEGDSDDDSEIDVSRSATPDLTKLTRRQRGQFEEDHEGDLLALSNEAQKKKVFTEEEHAMRRQEMARRRKNLSEKRNEEEKMDTINKLLKKPAPKRRTRAEILAAQHAAEMAGTPSAEDGVEERVDPLFVRYVTNREGSRVGVPDEWLEAPPGGLFRKTQPDAQSGSRMLVEEVS